jgi:hypothetical protein
MKTRMILIGFGLIAASALGLWGYNIYQNLRMQSSLHSACEQIQQFARTVMDRSVEGLRQFYEQDTEYMIGRLDYTLKQCTDLEFELDWSMVKRREIEIPTQEPRPCPILLPTATVH